VHHDPSSKIGQKHLRYGRPIIGYAEMSVAEHIEAATELMREITANGAWTQESLRRVEDAYQPLRDLLSEYRDWLEEEERNE